VKNDVRRENTQGVYKGKRKVSKKRSMGKGDRPGVKGQMGQKRGAERFGRGKKRGSKKSLGSPPRVLLFFALQAGGKKGVTTTARP
jgi:hypothetical protein